MNHLPTLLPSRFARHLSHIAVIGLLLGLAACSKAPAAPTPMLLSTPIAASASADATRLSAPLSGKEEVPPVSVSATGSAEATLNPQTKVLTWTVTYSGLTGAASGAHFHGPALTGANAGVAVPVTANLASPITGSATLSETQAADLLAGKWYFNVHTAAHPNGEIRGQLSVQP